VFSFEMNLFGKPNVTKSSTYIALKSCTFIDRKEQDNMSAALKSFSQKLFVMRLCGPNALALRRFNIVVIP